MNSWDKSDSYFGLINALNDDTPFEIASNWIKKYHPGLDDISEGELLDQYIDKLYDNGFLEGNKNAHLVAFIGPNDMQLAQKLIKAGPEHRKFLRQIYVSMDITAPLYWWK